MVELLSDNPGADLRAVETSLSLGVAAAMPRQGHRRTAGRTPRRPSARAQDRPRRTPRRRGRRHEVAEAVVEEVQGAFECTVVHLVAVEGEMLALRAERGRIDTPPGWSQRADVGLIGRALRERAASARQRLTREPQYRSTRATREVRSELVVPIYDGHEVWGFINLEDVAMGAFDADDAGCSSRSPPRSAARSTPSGCTSSSTALTWEPPRRSRPRSRQRTPTRPHTRRQSPTTRWRSDGCSAGVARSCECSATPPRSTTSASSRSRRAS